MNDLEKILQKTSLFKDIELQEVANLLKKIYFKKKDFKKDSLVLLQGDPYDSLYIILDGNAYGEMIDYTGKIAKIEEFHSPYVLASALLFSEDNTLPVSVITRNDLKVLIIPKKEVLNLFSLNKVFLNNFITDLSDKFVFLSKKLKFLAFKTLKEKIANYLYSLPKNNREEIIIPNTLEELANYFSVERPSLSRVLLQLEKENIIKRENKRVVILDKKRLFG